MLEVIAVLMYVLVHVLMSSIFGFVAASRLGIYSKGSEVMSGGEIESLDVHQIAAQIHNVEVFYRANPKHKLKIVKVCCTLTVVLILISNDSQILVKMTAIITMLMPLR